MSENNETPHPISTSPAAQRGAYAALQREARECPNVDALPLKAVENWYKGFDEARRRMALLEGELIRGEAP